MADNQLAMMLASQGAKGIRNPVARFALGLPTGGLQVPEPQAQQVATQQGQGSSSGGAARSGIQDRLLARIRTRNDTGFAVPGPGTIPGFALRPEVRQMFEGQGGVSAIDVSNLSPEEENGLMIMLDPKWVSEHQPSGA
jgi:hypothetical protein